METESENGLNECPTAEFEDGEDDDEVEAVKGKVHFKGRRILHICYEMTALMAKKCIAHDSSRTSASGARQVLLGTCVCWFLLGVS